MQKYLNAAIEARSRQPDKLKHILLDASLVVQDDKASTNEFSDTLERIVVQLKNETDHSAAFLQKVKKNEAPDYYDVIANPMDLSTLQKRVKSHMYRSKKAFADDLDLIWSNCLAYNTHPSHPLRRSAEFLRARSNQLLEFITDPALPGRQASLLAGGGSRLGTPMLGDDDDEATDDDSTPGGRKLGLSGTEARLRSTSPGATTGGSGTPLPDRERSLAYRGSKLRPGTPMGSEDVEMLDVDEDARKEKFEDRPAIIRTAEGMQLFEQLDQELAALEGREFALSSKKGGKRRKRAVLDGKDERGSLGHIVARKGKAKEKDTASLLRKVLATSSFSAVPSAGAADGSDQQVDADAASSSREGSLLASTTAASDGSVADPSDPELGWMLSQPSDTAWWTVVAGVAPLAAAAASGSGPVKVEEEQQSLQQPGLSLGGSGRAAGMVGAGLPACFAPGSFRAAGPSSVAKRLKQKAAPGSGAVKPNGHVGAGTAALDKGKGKFKVEEQMWDNVKALRGIKRLHSRLLEGKSYMKGEDVPFDVYSDASSAEEEEQGSKAGKPKKRRRQRQPFREAQAQEAVTSGVRTVLAHEGFDATQTAPLGVLSELASEYILNMGRTLAFFKDRMGPQLASAEQMILHSLAENGLPEPEAVKDHVLESVNAKGRSLTELLQRLSEARKEQIDRLEASRPPPNGLGKEDDAMDQDPSSDHELLGEEILQQDLLNIPELALDEDGLQPPWIVPPRLWKGEPASPSSLKIPRVPDERRRHVAPAPCVPLTVGAIDAQIGLLRPILKARAEADLGMDDEVFQPTKAKNSRPRVPPSGKIPVKSKKKDDGGVSKKKKKKEAQAAAAAASAALANGNGGGGNESE